jgi:hypothetical protein
MVVAFAVAMKLRRRRYQEKYPYGIRHEMGSFVSSMSTIVHPIDIAEQL